MNSECMLMIALGFLGVMFFNSPIPMIASIMYLIAEVAQDPLGGWGAMMLQAGALGLLAYIVIVTFPAQQKELREEREKRDELFNKALEMVQVKFSERNDKLISALERQTGILSHNIVSVEKATRETGEVKAQKENH